MKIPFFFLFYFLRYDIGHSIEISEWKYPESACKGTRIKPSSYCFRNNRNLAFIHIILLELQKKSPARTFFLYLKQDNVNYQNFLSMSS